MFETAKSKNHEMMIKKTCSGTRAIVICLVKLENHLHGLHVEDTCKCLKWYKLLKNLQAKLNISVSYILSFGHIHVHYARVQGTWLEN